MNGALVESPGVHTLPLFSTTNYNSDKTYYYTDEDPYVTGYYNIDTTREHEPKTAGGMNNEQLQYRKAGDR